MSRQAWKILLPIVVLIAGAGATAALIGSRKAPPRNERPAVGPLVETMTVEPQDFAIDVQGQGEVRAAVQVDLLPEVSGRVVAVHPDLVTGGRFRAGETLVEIDPRDYELAVERARAAVARAQVQLEREQAEGDAARAEWLALNGDAEPPGLLVREPQIRQYEAELAAARADLATAELALQRTRLSLPFDGVVVTESVDRGQLLTQGRDVATVYGTAAVEIRLPLDDRELAWFDLPAGGPGPRATVSADFAGGRHTWEGRVDRLEGQVDPRSRMVGVVVRVADPMATDGGKPPLMPGTFVQVAISGRQLEGVYRLPRHTLREGGTVWVVEGDRLRIRQAEVLRSDRAHAYLGAGLNPGERVVTSSLDAVTDGMLVRLAELEGDA